MKSLLALESGVKSTLNVHTPAPALWENVFPVPPPSAEEVSVIAKELAFATPVPSRRPTISKTGTRYLPLT